SFDTITVPCLQIIDGNSVAISDLVQRLAAPHLVCLETGCRRRDSTLVALCWSILRASRDAMIVAFHLRCCDRLLRYLLSDHRLFITCCCGNLLYVRSDFLLNRRSLWLNRL